MTAAAKRRIFVGDVQGCCDELQSLLEKVRLDPAADRLYCVGDAINRGPQNAKTLRLLRQLGAVMVLGNHEMHWFEVFLGTRAIKGRDTLEDLAQADDRDELTSWLKGCGFIHVEPDVVMVHAGLRPSWKDYALTDLGLRHRLSRILEAGGSFAFDDPDLRFAVSVRTCDPLGAMPHSRLQENDPPFRPWDEHYAGPRIAVFGHWAQRGLVVTRSVRGLDSGCVYGNQLSAWIAEEDRIVQVPARRVHCPIE